MTNLPEEILALDVEALSIEIARAEERQAKVNDFAARLEKWNKEQQFNIFGQLTAHIDSQLRQAKSDLEEVTEFTPPYIPPEQDRIDFRKDFHRSILRSGRRTFTPVVIFLLVPTILGFIDSLARLTPIGKAIYPIAGAFLFVAFLIFTLVRRAKKGKTTWPNGRVALWLSSAFIGGALLGLWPLIGIPVKWFINYSPLYPSPFTVIFIAMAWALGSFLAALLRYHANYRGYYRQILDAHSALAWRSGGTLNTRTAILKLEIARRQVQFWAKVLGAHLRKPWIAPEVEEQSLGWSAFANSFPPSIRLAQALETNSVGENRPIEVLRTISGIVEAESSNGWRTANLERLVKLAEKFNPNATPLTWDGIDSDNTAAPNGSHEQLIRLVNDEAFLTYLGARKVEELGPGVQDQILENAELKVATAQANRGQEGILNWDDHLQLAVGDVTEGAPPLAQFSIKPAHQPEGYNTDVISVISAPPRLLMKIEESSSAQIPSSVELVEMINEGSRSIDLVLRIDIAGLNQAIPISAVTLPESVEPAFTLEAPEGVCGNCGQSDCPSLTSRATCKKSGV